MDDFDGYPHDHTQFSAMKLRPLDRVLIPVQRQVQEEQKA